MSGVLEKQLVLALDRRWTVFVAKEEAKDLLQDEMSLRAAAYMASELILPCCCMLCSKKKLYEIFVLTRLCQNNQLLAEKLAALVYDDLARCNGLG